MITEGSVTLSSYLFFGMSEKTGLKFIRFGELISHETNSSFLLWFQYSASLRRSSAWNFKYKDSILKWVCQECVLGAFGKCENCGVTLLFLPWQISIFNFNVQRNVLIWPNFKNVKLACAVSVGQSRLIINLCRCTSWHMFEDK